MNVRREVQNECTRKEIISDLYMSAICIHLCSSYFFITLHSSFQIRMSAYLSLSPYFYHRKNFKTIVKRLYVYSIHSFRWYSCALWTVLCVYLKEDKKLFLFSFNFILMCIAAVLACEMGREKEKTSEQNARRKKTKSINKSLNKKVFQLSVMHCICVCVRVCTLHTDMLTLYTEPHNHWNNTNYIEKHKIYTVYNEKIFEVGHWIRHIFSDRKRFSTMFYCNIV